MGGSVEQQGQAGFVEGVRSHVKKFLDFSCRSSLSGSSGLLGNSLGALTEVVLGTSVDNLKVTHAASSSGAATESLEGPVVAAHLGSGETTGSTLLLLDVV